MNLRTSCIVCNTNLKTDFFHTENDIYVAHYATDEKMITNEKVPYNICVCEICNTPQLKHLAQKTIEESNRAMSKVLPPNPGKV
jgi:hypothetical protein